MGSVEPVPTTAEAARVETPAPAPLPPGVPCNPLAAEEQDLVADVPTAEASEADGAAGAEPAPPTPPPATFERPIPADLLERLYPRLSLVVKLLDLEKQRRRLAGEPQAAQEVRDEIERQDRELRRGLSAEQAQAALQAWTARREARAAAAAAGQAEAPSPLAEQVAELGRQQLDLFRQRDDLTEPILEAGWRCLCREPLATVLGAGATSPRTLFGWAAYAFALVTVRERGQQQQDEARAVLDAGAKGEEAARRRAAVDLLASLAGAIERELAWIEEAMTRAFWAQYEQAAALWVEGRVPAAQTPVVRAFLRSGMIGGAPWFLPPALADAMLQEAAQPIAAWDDSLDATPVLYADEYLWHAAQGAITPSIDEDLELNQRLSVRWKQDKAWRRVVFGRGYEYKLTETLRRLEGRHNATEGAITQAQVALAQLERGRPDYVARREELKVQIQNHRIDLARLTRIIERTRQQAIPLERQRSMEATEKLSAAGGPPSPADIVRREAAQMHRVCRLCAKLKDAFPPLTLAEHYRPAQGQVHDRRTLEQELQELERLDPTIFKDALTHDRKQANRVYVRQAPYVLLAPGMGIMGFSWNPRGGNEQGRLVAPLYAPRPRLLGTLLTAVCADFRWDTSRESAGIDLLTSDTLAAAYATIRWNFRRCSKEVRERCAIYNNENDRKNFRRHYALYLSSALQGGRKLYYKCAEVYEAFLRYAVLPEGVERLG